MTTASPTLSPMVGGGSVDFLSVSRYPQSSYAGRVRAFFSVIDPRTLLATEAQVAQAQKLIEEYKAGKREGVTQEQIWQAKKLRVRDTHSAQQRESRTVSGLACAMPH